MKKQFLPITIVINILFAVIFSGCDKGSSGTEYVFTPGVHGWDTIQSALITMEDGSTIRFEAGTFDLSQRLTISQKNNITIEGSGRDNTILSFAGQTSGAEGLSVTDVNWFLIKDITIQETDGDAIKIKDSDGISMINVAAIWSDTANENNGAYGLYPVTSSNILIDECYVKGASDAGIYVGQSDKAIVRNSVAEFNVAGIEIENTTNADVYGNLAQYNTGGILVFDLPGLSRYGKGTRVFENTIKQNDSKNFAPAGNIVANVPVGTGIMVMSTKEVEIFENDIINNNIMGLGIVSYLVLQTFDPSLSISDSLYDPYPSGVNVHDNTFSSTGGYPSENTSIGDILTTLVFPNPGDMPDILFDGIIDSTKTPGDVLCIHESTASFANLDADNFFTNLNLNKTPHDCSPASLPEVTVDAPGI